MNSDIILVIGIFVLALASTTWLSAFSNMTWRWPAPIFTGIGLLMVVIAWLMHPGGYPPREMSDAFIRVLALIIR